MIIIFYLLISLHIAYSQDNNIRELRIMHWNDFHSRNLPYKISKRTGTDTIYYYVGGVSGLIGYIKQYKDDKSLLLHAGDEFQGTAISTLTKGESQIKLLELYDLDAITLGNHDFDYTAKRVNELLKTAKYKFLAGNLYYKPENRPFGDLVYIKEINNIKIGIIGLVTDELYTLTLPTNVQDIEILNTDSCIKAGIQELKNNKCDLIILLTHFGVDKDSVFATKYYGDVDIIIGGHSHTTLKHPKKINGVLICQAGAYGRYLGKLDLKVDIEKDTIVYYDGNLIEVVFDSLVYDKEVQQYVEKMEEEIKPLLNRVIGTLEVDWHSKGINCNLGQWEADVFRKKTSSDISFINSGGIRKDVPKGNITVRDIWEVNPFGNTLNTFKISGKFLKEMIENHFKKVQEDIEKGEYPDFLIFSGLTVVYNSEEMAKKQVGFIKSIKVNGKDIEDDKIYQVATTNYVVSQINKYFGNLSEKINAIETNMIDRDVLIEAVEQQKVINNQSEERLIDEAKKY
ncbi:MAG: bifunctional metallophosphatase/5'-nucleotidase [Ignavibacteria bacterium]|nr:bifunctional metallophosphatase/5'-nucleotidase [Ignavibacteria bacterium]